MGAFSLTCPCQKYHYEGQRASESEMPSLYRDIDPAESAEPEILKQEIKLPICSGYQYTFHNIFLFCELYSSPERGRIPCLIFEDFTPI